MSKGNEPAYPVEAGLSIRSGLTKREYFAGLAMQGIRANHESLVMLANRKDLDGEIIDLVAALAVLEKSE